MNKPLTATEIKEGWEKGCSCGICEYCYIGKRIEAMQKAIFEPLIKRVKEILDRDKPTSELGNLAG